MFANTAPQRIYFSKSLFLTVKSGVFQKRTAALTEQTTKTAATANVIRKISTSLEETAEISRFFNQQAEKFLLQNLNLSVQRYKKAVLEFWQVGVF